MNDMKYRTFPGISAKVSLLGYGCMRFPVNNDDPAQIIEEQAEALIDRAYQDGVTYFDTAWPYHGERSESVSGRILRKYPRDSYNLADKLPIWLIKKEEDTEYYFFKQLERCGVDYFDFYLIHSMDRKKYEIAKNNNVYAHLVRLKEQGYIRHLGFSFHDTAEVLQTVLGDDKWDFVQIQLNYLDWELQDAKAEYELLASRKIPCIVMEPTRGGVLAKPPAQAAEYLKAVHPEKSCASWAIRFAASLPGILCVLSGMQTTDIVDENVQTVSTILETPPAPGSFAGFTAEESRAIDAACSAIRENRLIGCTGCGYCRDCPKGVNIPRIFAGYNQYLVGKDRFQFYNAYSKLPDGEKAKNCISCKQCMQHCPQGLPIPEKLAEIQALVDEINANRPASWFEI